MKTFLQSGMKPLPDTRDLEAAFYVADLDHNGIIRLFLPIFFFSFGVVTTEIACSFENAMCVLNARFACNDRILSH